MKAANKDVLAEMNKLAGFDLNPKASHERKEWAKSDFEYFARTYFPR